MDAETLELARRFVACKGWVWLPGMAAFRPYHAGHLRIESTHESGFGMSPVLYGSCSWFSLSGLVPDLSDPLTCAGLLEVVRRAWGAPYSYPEPVESFDSDGVTAGVSWRVRVPGRRFEGGTEPAALLAALEAAPHA